MINAIILVVAVIYATAYWNSPSDQFGVGMNVVVALWCATDLLKDLLFRS